MARMFDFFGRRTSWHRRLWNGSLVASLAEAAEVGERTLAIDQGHEHYLAYRRFLRNEITSDGGVPDALREHLSRVLASKSFPAQTIRELRELTAQLDDSYLATWRHTLRTGNPPIERLSRAPV